jgi:hypothetical protein
MTGVTALFRFQKVASVHSTPVLVACYAMMGRTVSEQQPHSWKSRFASALFNSGTITGTHNGRSWACLGGPFDNAGGAFHLHPSLFSRPLAHWASADVSYDACPEPIRGGLAGIRSRDATGCDGMQRAGPCRNRRAGMETCDLRIDCANLQICCQSNLSLPRSGRIHRPGRSTVPSWQRPKVRRLGASS